MAKRLYRSRDNRVFGGVCAGLAAYFDVDPLVMRLLFVALLLFGVAPIIILYLIMWIVVPEAPRDEDHA